MTTFGYEYMDENADLITTPNYDLKSVAPPISIHISTIVFLAMLTSFVIIFLIMMIFIKMLPTDDNH